MQVCSSMPVPADDIDKHEVFLGRLGVLCSQQLSQLPVPHCQAFFFNRSTSLFQGKLARPTHRCPTHGRPTHQPPSA